MRIVRTIGTVVSCLIVAAATLAGAPAEAKVTSPQNVHVSSSKGLYMVNWSAVKGATTYDVEFIPHDKKGKRLFGPYVPHWTKTTNFSIAMSKLPSPKFGFETVVYSNVVDSPKPVDPKTQDYSSKTKVSDVKSIEAARRSCRARSGWAILGGLAAGGVAVAITAATGGTAAVIAASLATAEGGSLAGGAVEYFACMDGS